MAPVATSTAKDQQTASSLKKPVEVQKTFNPFYSPPEGDNTGSDYKYAHYKPHFPNVSWEPLGEIDVVDRGTHADSSKKNLFSAATKVTHLTPAIGTEIEGIDLRQLTEAQKDELALLVAERNVVFFRDQEIDINEQLDLARHWGPLHKHATTPITANGLEEVHVVFNDSSRRPDSSAFSKLELWHSDVTYELQPPGPTSLKVITGPEVGGDTLWSSGYALYSSLSPGFQKYLEGLSAVHSGVAQAEGNRAAGLPVRRKEVESVHPLVRVHPATGWKSVFVNPGFTRRIVDIPKAESDTILNFLFRQISENPDFQVRFKWQTNSIAIWDNRVTTHSATFDFWPATRHALRATPHAERPLSVEAYEQQYGKQAKDRQIEIWRQQGVEVTSSSNGPSNGTAPTKARYND
ncbi:alpha-ketoglutarate-dependent sulfonate dioxygenase [Coprinopsis sp. MPI-PUGE-AT-0042]|nr:alpha-ketoglutarate-dependent sulfonate dioxygenase [Coprinopsis sp. MPI-PUGE-AT-0042]